MITSVHGGFAICSKASGGRTTRVMTSLGDPPGKVLLKWSATPSGAQLGVVRHAGTQMASTPAKRCARVISSRSARTTPGTTTCHLIRRRWTLAGRRWTLSGRRVKAADLIQSNLRGLLSFPLNVLGQCGNRQPTRLPP